MVEARDPQNPGHRSEFTSQVEVEQACLCENHQRFTQASRSPFLREPLCSQVGPNQFTEQILEHGMFPPTFDSMGVDPSVFRLLPFLRKPAFIKDQPWELNADSYAYGWSRVKAQTST